MNEAIVTFVVADCEEHNAYTKIARIEFEGSCEDFLDALNTHGKVRVVAMESLSGTPL
jgi:hypothetical protein